MRCRCDPRETQDTTGMGRPGSMCSVPLLCEPWSRRAGGGWVIRRTGRGPACGSGNEDRTGRSRWTPPTVEDTAHRVVAHGPPPARARATRSRTGWISCYPGRADGDRAVLPLPSGKPRPEGRAWTASGERLYCGARRRGRPGHRTMEPDGISGFVGPSRTHGGGRAPAHGDGATARGSVAGRFCWNGSRGRRGRANGFVHV